MIPKPTFQAEVSFKRAEIEVKRGKGDVKEVSERQVINIAGRWQGRPYSAAVRWGSLIFTSGYTGIDPGTGDVPAGIKAQTRQCFENIREVLEAAGTSLSNTLKISIFLTSMSHYQEMNEVYREYFQEDLPSRSCVEVSRLTTPEKLIEIEVIAAVM